jgi:hypothetical protein
MPKNDASLQCFNCCKIAESLIDNGMRATVAISDK